MEPDMSTRQTFECYLYDYLVKRNMHETAEVFRNEANLPLDHGATSSSNAIDVAEGFLSEWWSLNYNFDCFSTWLQMNEQHGLEATHGCNASQEARYFINEEALSQLPDSITPIETFNTGRKSMQSHGQVTGELPIVFLPSPNGEVSGELPQLILPHSHQDEQSTSTMRTIDKAKTNGPTGENTSKAEYVEFSKDLDPMLENLLNSCWVFEQDQPGLFDKSTVGEINRNLENLLPIGEGTILNEFDGLPPALHNDDNNSEISDCSSTFQKITTNAANQLESNEET